MTHQPQTVKRKIGLALLGSGLLLGALQFAAPWVQAEEETDAAQRLKETSNYTVTSAPVEPLNLPTPTLPDLSGYTLEAVNAKIERNVKGRVVVRRMLQQDALKDFIGGDERLREWVTRQGGMPHAIFIEDGYVTPADLARALPDNQFSEVEPGVYLARLPIVVAQGATLHVDPQTADLRLSQERGAFLVNDGKLFITSTRLTAWREADNAPATFREGKEFRPFLVSWGGSELYIASSVVTSLGYDNSKSYGVSITQYTPGMHERLQRAEPTGWLIDSEFVDHWYGFYCYEAQNVVIKGNTYRDNIVYGIDPHDRSHGLIIAENTVHGTKKKHGIIISREVDDSWIINNKSYDNKLSGIVIDRNSVRNLIAYNEVYQNHADGITLYESSNNLLWGNQVLNNKRHGIRVRNSVDIKLYENVSAANGLTGVYGHIKDLSDTDRNISLDPFDAKISMIVVGGTLAANGSSPLSIDSPLSVELYRVQLLAPSKSTGISFAGILGEKQEEILDLMVRRDLAVLIDPVESQAELQD
ncbi:MAG: mannuronan 5-epimerase AlgG [Gammaproteobacteria bacterium]|nr:mannuronan 5-epimerase AlgG [Gammaproteobacteria bacterium]MBU1488726.1 mannuronan 5-epimerase AlgG [Gammaproteobacteria bacterium]MBU2067217.1 mannuronan 5-epimerase AlgG [Gammaproteobacteria bacterium]MBU2138813.1 mannuronan 5-epimerase AlgG [Gammaproteobacteria bacterium]MBU2217500.1 mannuronan 5-epimerase AlgG [Gammaproteobacteria bacterium]